MNHSNIVQQKQNRDEKIEAAHAALADAVARLQTGDSWRDMLAKVARGGRYSLRRLSFRNQILVSILSPDATCVATYGAWQKVGRQVRKGEKALTILAPVIVSKTKENSDEAESVLVGFRSHPVFSGEQTEAAPGGRGQPLPQPVRITKDLTMPEAFEHSVEILRDVCLSLANDVISSIDLRPRCAGDPASAHGWFNRQSRQIVVITGERERAHEFKTLIHEVAHAILHGSDDHHARPEMEVEAESAAFVASSILGLDTGDYSFPYVALWAGEEDAQAMIFRSGQRIVKAVNVILDALLGAKAEPVEQKAA